MQSAAAQSRTACRAYARNAEKIRSNMLGLPKRQGKALPRHASAQATVSLATPWCMDREQQRVAIARRAQGALDRSVQGPARVVALGYPLSWHPSDPRTSNFACVHRLARWPPS